MTKDILVRAAKVDDARAIIEVHHDAVHITARADYGDAVLTEWSAPVSTERVQQYQIRSDASKELTLVAEIEGKVVGFGAIVPENEELRAVYVSPKAARTGVGSALLRALESHAIQLGVGQLWLDSSLTAEPFYRLHGYQSDGYAEHTLKSGRTMACVKMRKKLEKISGSPAGI